MIFWFMVWSIFFIQVQAVKKAINHYMEFRIDGRILERINSNMQNAKMMIVQVEVSNRAMTIGKKIIGVKNET